MSVVTQPLELLNQAATGINGGAAIPITSTVTNPLSMLAASAAAVSVDGGAVAVAVANSPLEMLSASAVAPNLEALTQVYNKNFYRNFLFFSIITIIFIVVLVTVFLGGSLNNVLNNWPAYRCNPMIMPFAALYGHDATENFNYCMKNIFNSNAAAVLGPVYGLIAQFTNIAGTIAESANSFRYLIANLLKGMERLMQSYRDRFQFLIFSIRMSFLKMQTLMGRLHGSFYSLIFMGLSGLKAADNVSHNGLVEFLMEFCFDPNTPIILHNGGIKKISELQIGDILKEIDGKTPIVTSLFRFKGDKTPMVSIGNTLVSKEHYMYYNYEWIKSGDHPFAKPADSIPELVCLNTDTHTVEINGLIFSDYDESGDSVVVQTAQALAEIFLNNGLHDDMVDCTSEYSLGMDPHLPVLLENGETQHLFKIKVGDVLFGGNIVLGTVKELCQWIVKMPSGLFISASQLIWDSKTNRWRRAAFVYPNECTKWNLAIPLHQLITTTNIIETADFKFRDYREVNHPDMEAPYSDKLSKN